MLNYGINPSEKEEAMRVEREYHGVELRVLHQYLIELGGKMIGEACISGEGWSATVHEGEPFTVGKLKLNTLHLFFEGDIAVLNRLLSAFDLKMLRAGG
jgi:hypothetical protein